ncbi:MAG: hypothetical protein ACRDTP_09005, partial [Mycobacteriales bacterium]
FGGPVSYRQPAGYVPPASVDVLTMPPPVDDPSAPSDDHDVSEADPEHQEPPLSAEPSPDLAPTGPHLEQVPAPSPSLAAGSEPSPEPATSETSRTEEMPPAVLRAALRDALPDALSAPVASGPADAVFGDPRWSLPPEEAEEPEEVAEVAGRDADATDQPDEVAVDLTGEDTDRLRAAAAAEEDAQSFADEPVQEPYFEPAAPARPRTPPTYADLGYGFPRPADQLTVADVALRLAFRSEDRELAEAVVRLVARQARERSRLQTAEAYLDAILDEGDAALPGAARLRRVLAD